MFSNKYYKHVDGVAIGSPLGPALANIFMCRFESKWLRDCSNDFKPVFYRRYVDDMFALSLPFCYDNKQFEAKSFIFPNLLHRGYKEVFILITV